jgi:replicative superfamily II helicase
MHGRYEELLECIKSMTETENKAEEVAEILCDGAGEKRERIESALSSALSAETFVSLEAVAGMYTGRPPEEISVHEIEAFDTFLTLSEKAKILYLIEKSSNLGTDLFKVLVGDRVYFHRMLVRHRDAFKCLIMYQLFPRDRRQARESLRKKEGAESFLSYLDRDVMGHMRGSRIIDFEKMAENESVDVTELKYPEGSRTVAEAGMEVVYVPGRKKTVEHDSSVPGCIGELFGPDFRFNYIQSVVYGKIMGDISNVLVCAPTGAGKTAIAAFAILKEIQSTGSPRVAYIAPMKALVEEIYASYRSLFSKHGLRVVRQTSDIHIPYPETRAANILIATPEKLDILMRNGAYSFNLLVVDEMHLLGTDRGPVIEAIVARALRKEDCRIVALSASLPNYADVGSFIRCRAEDIFHFEAELRHVPISYELVNTGDREKEMPVLIEKILENVEANSPMLVFVHSRSMTLAIAQRLRHYLDRQEISEEVAELMSQISNPKIREVLRYGVGIHHAALDAGTRSAIEELYRRRHIGVLVSTATLAWGVNLPARTVIIKGSEVYDPRIGGYASLDQTGILQMFGRAGRSGAEEGCKGILISSRKTEFLTQKSVDSHLLVSICDCLNAEISMGMSTFEEAVDWLKYTFYNVRLMRLNREPARFLNEIVYSALKHLEKAGAITIDSRFYPTPLGRICARYYLHYRDTKRLLDGLRPFLYDASLLSIVGSCREFSNIQAIDAIMEEVPVPCKSAVGAYLQAYIAGRDLEDEKFQCTMQLISQNAPRIFKALFEISLHKSLALSKMVLGYHKSLIHRFFPYQSPLRHFIQDEKVVRDLEMKKIPFEILRTLSKSQLNEIGLDGEMIVKNMAFVPHFRISPSVYLKTDDSCILNVEVEKAFDSSRSESDLYYLFITDAEERNLLLWDTVTFTTGNTYLSLYYAIPATRHPFINISMHSDFYISHPSTCILDLRDVGKASPSVFSDVWKDCELGTEGLKGSSGSKAVVVLTEAQKKKYAMLGYEAYTYNEFVREKTVVESVVLRDVHSIITEYIIEACIVHCIRSRIRMVLAGLPPTCAGDIGDLLEEEGNRDSRVNVFSSSSLSHYNRLSDFKGELAKNMLASPGLSLVICPTMNTLLYFAEDRRNIANEFSVVKHGVYFMTRSTVDRWMERNPTFPGAVHIVDTSYYDYVTQSYVDYRLMDVKRYSTLGERAFLYLRKGKERFYYHNGTVPLYYMTSNREELRIYSCWFGCPSGAKSLFIDEGLTEWGRIVIKHGVSIGTVELFMGNIKNGMGLRNILSLVCSAEELAYEVTSDEHPKLSPITQDFSKGKVHALASHFIDKREAEDDVLLFYVEEALPMLCRLYKCLLDVSVTKLCLKTSFNVVFGMQRLMKNFVEYESKFYSVRGEGGCVVLQVQHLPDVVEGLGLCFFFLSDQGVLRTLEPTEPGEYRVEWESGACYCLCNCYGGYEGVVVP